MPTSSPSPLFPPPPPPSALFRDISGSAPPNVPAIQADVLAASSWIQPLREQIAKVLVGQHVLVDRLLIALLSGGHVLLEGVPGLAKTLALKTLSQAIRADFRRIQFTPDMLPADIVGTLIYNPRDGHFETKRGPIFANLILADEINRAPAKVQSALLEAMQERQVTLGDTTHALPSPFMVMATQNPVEQEGTYPLPEAQMDRFLLKVVVSYPSPDEELHILGAMATSSPRLTVSPVVSATEIVHARRVVDELYLDEKVRRYIVSLSVATRTPERFGLGALTPLIRFGASPRATIALALCAKAWAFLNGRGYVTPQDVKTVALDVLRHRVAVTYEAEAERVSSTEIVSRILDQVAIP